MVFAFLWSEVNLLRVDKPLLWRQHRNGKRKENHQAHDHNRRIHTNDRVTPCDTLRPRKPRDGTCCKKDWIRGNKVVVLRVKGHHQREKDQIEDAEEAKVPCRFGEE